MLWFGYVFVSSPAALSHNLAKLVLARAELGTFEHLSAFYFSFYDDSTPKFYIPIRPSVELIRWLDTGQ